MVEIGSGLVGWLKSHVIALLTDFVDVFAWSSNDMPRIAKDEDKIASVTNKGTYCYATIPFGLNNEGATYQRQLNKIFKGQPGRNMEAYIADMNGQSIPWSWNIENLKR